MKKLCKLKCFKKILEINTSSARQQS